MKTLPETLNTLRVDHDEILRLIPEGSRVLDLGCGDGTLLIRLINDRKITGQGVEIDAKAILECVGKGLSVYHGDIDGGLGMYEDNTFDYVIMNQTLQVLHHPQLVLREMLRVGKYAIVSLPNFAFWRVRSQLFIKGVMPISEDLPYDWFDTPNIHLCTVKDFYGLCRVEGLKVEATRFVGSPLATIWPNLFARTAIFVVNR
jgi:methionine biosynthesis protein MetW